MAQVSSFHRPFRECFSTVSNQIIATISRRWPYTGQRQSLASRYLSELCKIKQQIFNSHCFSFLFILFSFTAPLSRRRLDIREPLLAAGGDLLLCVCPRGGHTNSQPASHKHTRSQPASQPELGVCSIN